MVLFSFITILCFGLGLLAQLQANCVSLVEPKLNPSSLFLSSFPNSSTKSEWLTSTPFFVRIFLYWFENRWYFSHIFSLSFSWCFNSLIGVSWMVFWEGFQVFFVCFNIVLQDYVSRVLKGICHIVKTLTPWKLLHRLNFNFTILAPQKDWL